VKKIAKCAVLSLFLVFFLAESGMASDMKRADELFDKDTFQEALQVYESVFKESTDDDIRWRAFFRVCESLAHLFRYGEAAQKLISTPVPLQMPHRARILILKAEILRNFLLQYSHYQRRDVIESEEKDIFRLAPDEIKAEIVKSYIELWKLRGELLEINLREEGYFLDIEDTDFGMYPTLFDYLVLNWTSFLLTVEARGMTEEASRPEAKLLLVEEFRSLVHLDDPPALLAAQLMEEASYEKRRNRLEATERWKIRRLLLPHS